MIPVGLVGVEECGCCGMEHDEAMLLPDDTFGLICVGCDLALVELSYEA
jgi:hypothetical protein